MKKSLKRILSLGISVAMLLSFAPLAMAEGEAVAPGISKLPTGNADGRLIFENTKVTVGNGTTMEDAPVLIDGFHFSAPEVIAYAGAADISNPGDSVTLETPDGQNTITGTRTLTASNNTVEVEWSSEQSVKRLEMWVWPVGAIENYEIQYLSGEDWIKCSEGTLDQSQPTPETDAANYAGKRAVSYIMTFDAVTTTKLRFIAKSFKTGLSEAKIAEFVPRSHDNVNLLAKYSAAAEDNAGWLSTSEGNYVYNIYSSPYALEFGASRSSYTGRWDFRVNEGKTTNFWTARPTNTTELSVVRHHSYSDYFYYAVRLSDSPQKVNKITFDVSAGNVKEFEILYNTDAAATLNLVNENISNKGWKCIATVKGDYKAGDTASVYLPKTVCAENWMIRITDFYNDGKTYGDSAAFIDTGIKNVGLYVLNDATKFVGNVSVGGGKDESILTDGIYFRNYETSGLNAFDGLNPENNLDKLAKFTAVDSGIEYSWDSPVTMKRLDLWILNGCGGVGTYNIETSVDGSGWIPVMKDRNLDLYDGSSKTTGLATYHPIVFDAPITAKKIRFVIKSFADSSNCVAYISEAKISDTNEINLGEHPLYPEKTDKFKASSPYFSCYNMSTKNTYNNENAYSSTYWGFVWHYTPSGSRINLSAYTTSTEENAKKELWYGTSLNGSKAKINKITLDINAGSIQEFEIWAAPKNNSANINGANFTDKKPIEKYPNAWTKVATINCNISASSTESERTFEIPEAILADGFYFEATQFTEGTTLTGIDMYYVADYELTPFLKDAALEGNVEADSDVTFSVFSCNNENQNADVFFALFSNNVLKQVSKADCALSGVKKHTATYHIPADAGENLSVTAYLWDGKTLVPILQTPVTAPATN